MNTVSIGFTRDDGDFQLLATLNNNDAYLSPRGFALLVEGLRKEFQERIGQQVQVLHRQDAPDYVTIEE